MNTKFLALNLLIASCALANDFNQAQTQLHKAILNNSGEQVQQAITTVSTQGLGNETAEWFLLRAIMKENAEEIKAAVQQLITEGKNGNSPIIWAALLRKPNAIKPLLECGAKLDANIVKYAIKVGDLQTALIMIRHEMDISDITQDCMQLCIHRANKDNIGIIFELIQELWKRGYNFSNANNGIINPLLTTCDAKILKRFIENGINPNQIFKNNSYGETLLLMALGIGAKQAVEILLNAGANVNQIGTVKRCGYRAPVTPLFVAISHSNFDGVKLLLSHGANIHQASHVNDKAFTALTLAIENGNSAMVELLLERGAQY